MGGAGIVPKIKIFVSCHCAKNVCCHSAKSILVFKLSVCQKYFQLVSLPNQILNLVILPKTLVGNLPKRCENKQAMLCQWQHSWHWLKNGNFWEKRKVYNSIIRSKSRQQRHSRQAKVMLEP